MKDIYIFCREEGFWRDGFRGIFVGVVELFGREGVSLISALNLPLVYK